LANVSWTIKLYDKDGVGITAADMTPSATVSNTIKHAFERKLTFNLNGLDECEFKLYLHDPMAFNINRLSTYIKVWRTIVDDTGVAVYSDPSDVPCFAGIVVNTNKDGEANVLSLKAFSPFWRLQCRFHILNHYLKTDVLTSALYVQSGLMWKLIDLVNNAFGLDNSNTGIVNGTHAGINDPTVAPFFVAKGSNTWNNIFETIMARPGGVDIIPEYVHVDSDPTLMNFNTDEKRGADISATMDFRYHTGTTDNCYNLIEEELPVPNEFANYLWAVGQGGPNSGKIALEENINDDADGYQSIGIFMRRADFQDIKLIGLAGPPPTHLKAIAQSEFAQSRVPKTNYSVTVSPVSNIYYQNDFTVGDVVMLNANKGALVVTNIKQRIYETQLMMSENNIEVPQLTIAKDFTGKVAT